MSVATATVLSYATAAVYFADSSEYHAVLHRIINKLDPELYEIMLKDPRKAWEQADLALERERKLADLPTVQEINARLGPLASAEVLGRVKV